MNITNHSEGFAIRGRHAGSALITVLLFPLLLLGGCVLENMGDCTQYKLTVKIVGADGYELPSGTVDTVNVYLFDKTGFVRMVQTDKDNDFIFGYDKDDELTLVTWGNLKKDSLLVPTLTKGENPEEVLVQLRELEGYDLSSTDLFYARYTVHGDSVVPALLRSTSASSDTITLSLERMVASLSITGKYMSERFGTDTAGYRFVVRSAKNALNFLGVPAGDTASYVPGTSMNTDGQLVTPVIRVLPTLTDETLVVDLYRGSTLLYSTTTDSEGNALRAIAGKQLNVTLDFRYSFVRVTVTVTPWGEVVQDTEL
jgi:hypothetical protein